MSTVIFYAQETTSKDGLNGITVTWNVWEVPRLVGSPTKVISSGTTNVVFGEDGLYGYRYGSANLILNDYTAIAITADSTADLKRIPTLWTLWALSWHDVATSALTLAGSIGKLFTDNLNATVGSRSQAGDAMTLTSGTVVGIVNDVWTNGTRTLTSYGTLVADVWAYGNRTLTSSGGSLTPADIVSIWNYAWRTLTGPITPEQYAQLIKTRITCYKGDTLDVDFNSIDLSDAVDLIFTVKQNQEQADTKATLQLRAVGGLLYLNGVGATASDGTITYTATSANINIKNTAMVQVVKGSYYYDLTKVYLTGTKTIAADVFEVPAKSTKATS